MSGGLQPSGEGSSDGGDDSVSSGDGGGSGSASEEAGQDTAAGGNSSEEAGAFGDFMGELNSETERASQEALEEAEDIEDGITSFEELDRVQSGVFKYSETGVDLFDVNGNLTNSYDFFLEIDFGARIVGGGTSKIVADVGGSTNYDLPEMNFGDGDDPASFSYDNLTMTSGS